MSVTRTLTQTAQVLGNKGAGAHKTCRDGWCGWLRLGAPYTASARSEQGRAADVVRLGAPCTAPSVTHSVTRFVNQLGNHLGVVLGHIAGCDAFSFYPH